MTDANTYTGATQVNAGALLVSSPGSLAAGSAVTVGGAFATGTPTLGGTGNGPIFISGTGVAGTLTASTTVAIGKLTVNNNVTMQAGSNLLWEISAGTPTVYPAAVMNGFSDASSTKDLLAITGTAGNTLTASAPTANFNITQVGGIVTLIPANYYSFPVATTQGTPDVSGFGSLTAAGLLTSAPDFSAYIGNGGVASLSTSGNNVYLNLTPVPEPTTILGIAALGLGMIRLRRRVVG